MPHTIKDLAQDLLKVSQSKEEPELEACRDLVNRLASSSSSPKMLASAYESRTTILRSFASVSKALRVCKRSNAAWAPVLEQLTSITEVLQTAQSPPASKQQVLEDKASAASSSTNNKPSVPRTVQEYHERLKRQKKEIYKNPPVLPPHSVRIESALAPPPKRSSKDNTLSFEPGLESDASTVEFIHKFRPNLTPAEILNGGAFGGTYFRSIESAVTNQRYSAKEVLETTVQPEWIHGLDPKLYLTSSTYRTHINKYGVKCGGSLGMWESSGWISDADPYGWFQWYCRFYQGRRCSDDGRQISRWLGVAGPTGRFRTQLCNKIVIVASASGQNSKEAWKDSSISPVIRQTLVHWGLEITKSIVEQHEKRKRR